MGFSDPLLRLSARREPTPRDAAATRPALFAVLVAEATNLGLATMARASGIPYGQLLRVHESCFGEDALRECGLCGGELRKVFHPAGIVFKGSGFYATDSRASKTSGSDDGAKDSKPSDAKAAKPSDAKEPKGKGGQSSKPSDAPAAKEKTA